jgi:hypothetical protein
VVPPFGSINIDTCPCFSFQSHPIFTFEILLELKKQEILIPTEKWTVEAFMATASTPTQAQVSSYHSRRQAVTPMYILFVRIIFDLACKESVFQFLFSL